MWMMKVETLKFEAKLSEIRLLRHVLFLPGYKLSKEANLFGQKATQYFYMHAWVLVGPCIKDRLVSVIWF